jgi:hypothetical protein
VYQSAEIYGEMFAVPVTTLFAFSSLRANFPGAPAGFGKGWSMLIYGILMMKLNRSDYWSVLLFRNTDTNLLTKFDVMSDAYTILPVLIIMSLCVSNDSFSFSELG